jgi:imidazolonepropionase-like amidohydrolase
VILLDNCVVFDGHSAELAEGRSVLIEDGMIREIGAAGAKSASARVIDLAGRFLMPGMIDAHYHCYGTEINPAAIDRQTPQLRALHAKRYLEATLRRGFTTVRDAAGGDFSLAQAIESGLIDGPRLFFPGLALSQTGGHGDLRVNDNIGACSCAYCGALALVVDGPDEMRKAVRDQLRLGATQIKLFVSGGVLSPTDPIWMNQFCDEEIRVAVEEAATRRTYVMAHAHTNEATLRCLKNGVRSIEHATMLAADGARAIAEHDAFAVPTLVIIDAIRRLGGKMGLPAPMLAKVEDVGRHALASIELLIAAGARIGFGTDLLGPVMDMQSQEFSLRREVCSPLQILRSATSINAALLQMEGRLGTIASGAHADLIALDGNPLEDIHLLARPERFALIMRGGKIVQAATQSAV